MEFHVGIRRNGIITERIIAICIFVRTCMQTYADYYCCYLMQNAKAPLHTDKFPTENTVLMINIMLNIKWLNVRVLCKERKKRNKLSTQARNFVLNKLHSPEWKRTHINTNKYARTPIEQSTCKCRISNSTDKISMSFFRSHEHTRTRTYAKFHKMECEVVMFIWPAK